MSPTNVKRSRRRAKRLPQSQQPGLFSQTLPEIDAPLSPATIQFLSPSPETIFIGEVPLRGYLRENDLGWVIRLRAELEAADLSALIAAYDPLGRRAIHPVVLLGLVFYGIIERHSSLRSLEKLAKRDVGAWWLTGGLQPDHSTIGEFLRRHAAVLTEAFFITLTRQLCRKLKLTAGTVAGDGTVIEAAASHYRLLQAEAARVAASKAPDDERAQTTAAIANSREAERQARGEDPGKVRLSPVEPEALVQKQKNDTYRPSYKPSVLAHESGLIVGQRVEPGAEAAVLPDLLSQHELVLGSLPQRTLLDAGYHTHEVLGLFVSLELDVLCPAGTATAGRWRKQGARGRYGKADFVYDETRDQYACPAGQRLRYRGSSRNRHGRRYRAYDGAPCAACAQRGRCTTAKAGRVLHRFEGDELKEAMRQVLAQPAARQAYARRRAQVEPVFAELRERQGLTRFRRRGLAGVRLEFALHCTAYNLKRTLRLTAPFTVVFMLFESRWRTPQGVWRLVGLILHLPKQNAGVV
jgi:transposase